MNRRQLLSFAVFAACGAAILWPLEANRKFIFKIKTKTGEVVVNIAVEAKDSEAAKNKLREQYADCEILEMKEK